MGLLVVVVGLCVGLMSAMFGVGGGILMVPFIVLVLDKTQHLAEGTSLLVIVPTAVVGVIAHNKSGFVSFRTAAQLAIPGVVGSFLGARAALALDAGALQMYFGVFTVVVGLRLLQQGWQARSGTGG